MRFWHSWSSVLSDPDAAVSTSHKAGERRELVGNGPILTHERGNKTPPHAWVEIPVLLGNASAFRLDLPGRDRAITRRSPHDSFHTNFIGG